MGPVVARQGTVAMRVVSETTWKLAGPNPLKPTWVVEVKPVPLMVTAVPTGPLAGLTEVRLRHGAGGGGAAEDGGAGVTVKTLPLVALPAAVTTMTLPEVAPAGTTARMAVGESTANEAHT